MFMGDSKTLTSFIPHFFWQEDQEECFNNNAQQQHCRISFLSLEISL